MRDDQFVLDERVAVQQKRVARIGVDHQFVNFAQAEIVLHFHAVKRFAEAPVMEAGRHAVRPERVNDVGGANLVAHRIKIKPEPAGDFRNFLDRALQLPDFILLHPHPTSRLPKNVLSALYTSPFSRMMQYWNFGFRMFR